MPVVSGKITDEDVAAFAAGPGRGEGARARVLPHRHALDHALGARRGPSSRSGRDPRHRGRGRLRPCRRSSRASRCAGGQRTLRQAPPGWSSSPLQRPTTSSSSAAARRASRPPPACCGAGRRSRSRSSSRASATTTSPAGRWSGGGVFDRAPDRAADGGGDAHGRHVDQQAAVAALRARAQPGRARGRQRASPTARWSSPRASSSTGTASRACRRRSAGTASPPTTCSTWRPTPGSWSRRCSGGRALFTQPPMPIKCAGAPQKAMYLVVRPLAAAAACCGDIAVEFHTAGAGAVRRQGLRAGADGVRQEATASTLNFTTNLKAVDGPARKAWFEVKRPDGTSETVERSFDMIHVCPPQRAPASCATAPLADAAGWVEVEPGDAAAPRYRQRLRPGRCLLRAQRQDRGGRAQAGAGRRRRTCWRSWTAHGPRALYDGYGSCPLTVERGKIVLAEFGYGGKLLPTFPLHRRRPGRAASPGCSRRRCCRPIYWELMLKGREWLAQAHGPAARARRARGPGGVRLRRAQATCRQGCLTPCARRG